MDNVHRAKDDRYVTGDESVSRRTNAHFPPRGRLITQHGAIGDSHRIRSTFGVLPSRPYAKDGHRHALKNVNIFLIGSINFEVTFVKGNVYHLSTIRINQFLKLTNNHF